MNTDQKIYDITVIGAGPVGLFAAYYTGFRDLSCKIIDCLPQIGGQLTTLYPQKFVYDVAGFPKILATDLALNLHKQAQQYNPQICLEEKVQQIFYLEDGTIKLTTDKAEHFSKKIILTAGAGVFTPRNLEVGSAKKFENRGLYYVVKDTEFFKGKKLLVIGGGDTALDWALHLKDIAKKTYLVHRSNKFLAAASSVRRLMNSNIEVHTHTELKEILGDEHIQGAIIADKSVNQEKTLDVDTILCCIGYTPNLGPIKEWGLELAGSTIKVNPRMETNLTGVYAAGDVATYEGKLRLICTGFSDAAVAVNYAAHSIYPELRVFPGYSTNVMEQKDEEKLAHKTEIPS